LITPGLRSKNTARGTYFRTMPCGNKLLCGRAARRCHRSTRRCRRCRSRRTPLPKSRCPSGYRTGPLHVDNFARKSGLDAGSTRKKKGGVVGRNTRNSVWQCGTENRKYRWRARARGSQTDK
jgi:hypothetical protein